MTRKLSTGAGQGSRIAAQKASGEQGRFGELHRRSNGDVCLGAADPVLVDVLARYELAVDDVPGIEQAWLDKFGALAEPQPLNVEMLADRLMGQPDWGRIRGGPWLEVLDDTAEDGTRSFDPGVDRDSDALVLRVHTRNGGGNRECWHDGEESAAGCTGCANVQLQQHPWYLSDEDNEFDCTYADFLFRVPAEHRGAFVDAAGASSKAAGWDAMQRERQQIADGDLPPWRILATADEIQAHQRRRVELQREVMTEFRRSQVASHLDRADQIVAALAGEPATSTGGDWVLEVPDETRTLFKTRNVRLSDAVKVSTEAAAAAQKARTMAALREEIDSPSVSDDLHNYLVGELPPKTYRTTEGEGRKKRTVTRTYTPQTPFVQEEEKAAELHRRTAKELAELSALVAAHRATLRDDLERSDAAAQQLASLTSQGGWALGWPGDPNEVPPRPLSQHENEL